MSKKRGLSPTWHINTCIDRVVPPGMDGEVDKAHEASVIVARGLTRGAPLHDLDPSTVRLARMALISAKKWPNKKKLRCRFCPNGCDNSHCLRSPLSSSPTSCCVWPSIAR